VSLVALETNAKDESMIRFCFLAEFLDNLCTARIQRGRALLPHEASVEERNKVGVRPFGARDQPGIAVFGVGDKDSMELHHACGIVFSRHVAAMD
jgi:hypothetical protein